MHSEGYCSWFVYVSSNQDLTSGASVHPENDIMYSMGNKGQNICGDFSETAPLSGYRVVSHFGNSACSCTLIVRVF